MSGRGLASEIPCAASRQKAASCTYGSIGEEAKTLCVTLKLIGVKLVWRG